MKETRSGYSLKPHIELDDVQTPSLYLCLLLLFDSMHTFNYKERGEGKI